MNAKELFYRVAPKTLVNELRHRKHVHDVAHIEVPEARDVEPYVSPGNTVLDIGANFGAFTALFSKLVGPSGSVISFEPVPETFRTLAEGVKKQGLGNVTVWNKAISDTVGTASMVIPKYEGGSGDNLYEARIVSAPEAGEAISVPTATIDSLNLQAVHFIKIDVEGHELAALQGGAETLKRLRPILLVEVTRDETRQFLCDAMSYAPPRIVSDSNQLFLPA